MTWVDDMNRDAVAIAFPGYELQPDDRVTVTSDFTSDWGSEASQGYDYYNVSVEVAQGNVIVKYTSYMNEESADFWRRLMARGSVKANDV